MISPYVTNLRQKSGRNQTCDRRPSMPRWLDWDVPIPLSKLRVGMMDDQVMVSFSFLFFQLFGDLVDFWWNRKCRIFLRSLESPSGCSLKSLFPEYSSGAELLLRCPASLAEGREEIQNDEIGKLEVVLT